MIEIIALYNLCKRIGIAARDRGRHAIPYQLVMIMFWLGGQFGGVIVASVVLLVAFGDAWQDYVMLAYFPVIAGGIVGAWLAFKVVAGLPDLYDLEPPASK